MCSITGVGEGCLRFLGQIGSKLWFPWQQKAPLTYNGENDVSTFFSVVFHPILFILANNKDMNKISDELEFWSDRTTDYGVSCPWASKKFPIDLLWGKCCLHASSFIFDWIIIKLLITWTGIKAWTNLISGWIRPLTLELLALEWRKFYTFELEYLWGQLASLDQILCVASLGVGKGCLMFWGRLEQNSGVHGNRKPPL